MKHLNSGICPRGSRNGGSIVLGCRLRDASHLYPPHPHHPTSLFPIVRESHRVIHQLTRKEREQLRLVLRMADRDTSLPWPREAHSHSGPKSNSHVSIEQMLWQTPGTSDSSPRTSESGSVLQVAEGGVLQQNGLCWWATPLTADTLPTLGRWD